MGVERSPFHFSLPYLIQTLLSTHARCAALAAALALTCYWNSLQGGLVHDDIFAIRDNDDVRPDAPLSQVFANDFWGKPMSSNVSHKSYRPLTILTFRINYALHGLEPWGYHAVNVVLHAVVTALFGWLCRRVAFAERDLVFLAMCLFASHPVHTEAVTGVVGRAELLACIFFLLSFLSYLSSLTPGHWGRETLALSVCVLCGSAAMLFKENGATVFGVCLAYDILLHSRKRLWKALVERAVPVWPSLSHLLLRVVTVLTTVVFLLAFRISLLHGHLPHFSDHDNPASFADHLQTRALTYCYLFFFNARLLLAPITLCYDWQMRSIPLVEDLGDIRNIGTALFFVYLICLFIFSFGAVLSKHKKIVLFSLLLLIIPFLPASNLLIRVGFVVAERILYISSMGYCILLVQGIKTLSQKIRTTSPSPSSSPSSSLSPPLLFHLSLLLVALFAVRTVIRNPVWHTRESLFRSGLATVPHNAKIHYNYANFLKDSERIPEAIDHYREAIRLSPDHASSHNNLGSILDDTEAEYHFRQAVKHNPTHYRAFYNLGKNLVSQGRHTEAEAALRDSLRITPDYHAALMSLATLMCDTGRMEEGFTHMQKALQAAPHNPIVHNNMGAYLLRMGKIQEAITEYQQTLALDSHNSVAMSSLARAYRARGEDRQAEEWFLKSLSIKEDATTFHFLGALYFNTGRYKEAKQSFARALNMEPQRLDSLCSYCQSLLQLRELDEALKVASAALTRHPNTACLHFALSTVYANKHMLQKALEHSSKAVQVADASSKAEAHFIHAGVLRDLEQLDDAEKNYRQAVSLSPSMVNAHMNLGALLHLKKNYGEARKHYERVLSLEPGNQMAKDNLVKLDRLTAQNRA